MLTSNVHLDSWMTAVEGSEGGERENKEKRGTGNK